MTNPSFLMVQWSGMVFSISVDLNRALWKEETSNNYMYSLLGFAFQVHSFSHFAGLKVKRPVLPCTASRLWAPVSSCPIIYTSAKLTLFLLEPQVAMKMFPVWAPVI
jgi:hypothetical protein